mmetsp:Transcript_72821/g.168801  ORF Transcript_72821/g.168801 Transcript_72821/m.168801 type:complete len:252 (-) Transcript_72821:196-951(-)
MKSTVVLASAVALARGACDCEWKASRNECDLSATSAANALKGSTTPLAVMVQGMAVCNALSNNETCSVNSECAWSSTDGTCDIGESKTMQILMGNINTQEMFQKAVACGLLSSEATCGGNKDCMWNAECTVNEQAVMAAASPEFARLSAKETMCGSLTTSATCGANSECKWGEQARCEASQATMIKALGGSQGEALAAKADTCNGDTSKSACDSCLESGISDMASPSAHQCGLLVVLLFLGTLITLQRLPP